MSEENPNRLLELVADLACAWLSNTSNALPAEALPGLLKTIHSSLSALGNAGDQVAETQHEPAVTVRKSLASPEQIISLIDGKPYRMLKRHLATHGLTPDEYRTRYGLPASYPMIAPAYAAMRSEMAKKIGLGRKPKAAPATAAKGKAPVKAATKPSPKPAVKPRKPRAKKAAG